MNLLIIGCGSIGTTLAKALENVDEVEKVYMFDKSRDRIVRLAENLKKVVYSENLNKILNDVELVIEAASQNAVRDFAPIVLGKGKSILIMSVGALVDEELRTKLENLAKSYSCKIYLPSGALCGIDGVNAAAQVEIEEVVLISYKPPQALKDVPYLKRQKLDLETLTKPTVVFNGYAKDAVKYFPQNVNVAATIALAGIGFEKTKVKIIADPGAKRNIHRLIVKGDFGEFECVARNIPFPKNPKTSYIAALSAIAAVKKIIGNVWVGV